VSFLDDDLVGLSFNFSSDEKIQAVSASLICFSLFSLHLRALGSIYNLWVLLSR